MAVGFYWYSSPAFDLLNDGFEIGGECGIQPNQCTLDLRFSPLSKEALDFET